MKLYVDMNLKLLFIRVLISSRNDWVSGRHQAITWTNYVILSKFVSKVPINNKPALVQMRAWYQRGNKQLSEPLMGNDGLVCLHKYLSLCLSELMWLFEFSEWPITHLIYQIMRSQRILYPTNYGDLFWNFIMRCPGTVRGSSPTGHHHVIWTMYWRVHGDSMTWKCFLNYWPFVRGILQSLEDSPHKKPVLWYFNVFFTVNKNNPSKKLAGVAGDLGYNDNHVMLL